MILLDDFIVSQCCCNAGLVNLSSSTTHGDIQMKKFLAVVLATAMVAGVAAPTFAMSTSGPDCVFKDKTLCVTESLSPTTGD